MVINLVGAQFGRLTVIHRAARQFKSKNAFWKCKCSCGQEIIVPSNNLRSGNSKSCGCLSAEAASKRCKANLLNQRFGKLVVIAAAPSQSPHAAWECVCDCGVKSIVLATNLVTGHTASCGCYGRDKGILPDNEAGFKRLLYKYQRSAKQRGYGWELTPAQSRELTSSNCYYCGAAPELISTAAKTKTNAEKHGYRYNGIDRLDNTIGYTPANCVPCCEFCNRAKLDNTLETFLEKVRQIAARYPAGK